jgi:cyclopropane-fatty-acyl-phospholipid synthase
MIYSCAYFKSEKDSLEQAQMQKINLCCRKLQLQPDERLLDIGCGWGSLLIYAAKKFGIRGVGITLSQEQLEYGRQQIVKEGVEDSVQLEYLDYRDLPTMHQSFDKIVSIGMFEHVGRANMRHFLGSSRKRVPGSMEVIQA